VALTPVRGHFGALLKAERLAAGISQTALGQETGFDHSFISRLESGEREPTLETVDGITKALGLSQPERDRLRMAAGYMPMRDESVYQHPQIGELDRAIQSASPQLAQWALETVIALLGHLERSQESHG
jgi:transcriptional regulator with XRE-family HTH domain